MTGFDETVPPDDDPARDENAVDPQPDKRDRERQAKPVDDLKQDDELRAGQWGPSADDVGDR